jgi:putative transposase
VVKAGFNFTKDGYKQRYKCKTCGRTFTPTSKLVKKNRFAEGADRDILEAKIIGLRKFKRTVESEIFPLLDFELHPQAKYDTRAFLELLTHMAITHDFAENGSKTFEFIAERKAPSADDLLWHLAKFSPDEILARFTAVFDRVFRIANEVTPLRGKRFDVAVDFHDWPCRCKNGEGTIEIQRKKGCSRGYRFATINIVKPGFRFTLLALPVRKHSEMVGVTEKLVKFAMKRIKINRVYCDRWYYKREVVRAFKRLKVKFLIRALESTGIKKIRVIGSLPVVMDYEMRGNCPPYGRERVKLLIVRGEKDEIMYFITNSAVNEENAERFAELYRKRWGVEVSYRVKGDLKPKSASRRYVIRLFYFMFSACLYNLWALANLTVGIAVLRFVPGEPFITTKFFGAVLYLPAVPFDPG